jgi:signal transduction histidine kinase
MSESLIEDIYKSSLKFAKHLDSKEAFTQIVCEAVSLVGADYGSIFLVNEENEFYRAYTSIEGTPTMQPRKRGFAYEAYKTSKVMVISRREIVKYHPEFTKTGFNSLILIPLSYNSLSIGVLSLLSTKRNYFAKKKVRALSLFGSMASLVIRKVQLYGEAQEALQARDTLIGLMAHELRTPLTAINLQAQMLDSGNHKKIQPILTQKLVKETKRLSRLINQFLEIDQIKTGQLHYDWGECSLGQVIQDAVHYFKVTYPKYSVNFNNHLDGSDTVVGDADKLMQVVVNLLNNSAKFTDRNSPIEIELKSSLRSYIISVVDHGKGIPKKDLPRIFDRFYQGSNGSKEGLGLGLFLVKKIIEHHNGSVVARSELNKGSTFEVMIPKLIT